MGKVKFKVASAKKKARIHALVHRGVVIQQPALPPSTSLARIRRAAKIAVQRYAHDIQAAE